MKHLLPKYETEHNIERNLKISEVYDGKAHENACKEDYMKGRGKHSIDSGHIPFSISFSAKGDYLPMWTLYGQRGKGVCLKFDTIKLFDYVLSLREDYAFDEVVYSPEKRTKSILTLIDFSYKLYANDKKDKQKPTIEDKINELADLCLVVAPFYKYQDYEYEQEVRLAYTKHYPAKFDHNNPLKGLEQYEIKPFVEIPIPINCMEKIIIGPDANYEVMKHILELELENCGINPNIIKPSKISYRSK